MSCQPANIMQRGHIWMNAYQHQHVNKAETWEKRTEGLLPSQVPGCQHTRCWCNQNVDVFQTFLSWGKCTSNNNSAVHWFSRGRRKVRFEEGGGKWAPTTNQLPVFFWQLSLSVLKQPFASSTQSFFFFFFFCHRQVESEIVKMRTKVTVIKAKIPDFLVLYEPKTF